MTDTDLVSVVVLAWECRRTLRRCLESVQAQTHPRVELVVVDNGSTDDPRGVFDELAPGLADARWIGLAENTGFAAGMNTGIRATTGAVVIPLNCDAVLAPDFAAAAVEAFDHLPGCGALAPLVVRVPPEGDVDLGDAARLPLDGGAVRLRRRMRVVVEPDRTTPRPCAKANGACPVYRREALDAVHDAFGTGPFDERFVTFGEDTDLALRLWSLGWSTCFEPTLVAGHVRSLGTAAGVRDKRGEARTLLVAARHRNAWRHLPPSWLAAVAPVLVAEDVGLALTQAARGDSAAARDVVSAWRRIGRERGELRDFRRRHRTWRRIPAPTVYGGQAR